MDIHFECELSCCPITLVEEGKWNVGFKTSDDVIKDASCFSNIHFDGEWKDGEDVITDRKSVV